MFRKRLIIQNGVRVQTRTQYSVDCTVRMAASLGYEVTVVSDATAATSVTDINGRVWTAEDVQALTLAHLKADYASIQTVETLIETLTE